MIGDSGSLDSGSNPFGATMWGRLAVTRRLSCQRRSLAEWRGIESIGQPAFAPVMKALLAIGLALVLMSGCTGQRGASAVGDPERHDLASNSRQAVSAGSTFSHPFQAQGQILVAYSVAMKDDSSVDIGFVRQEDLAEYRGGQAVSTWAYQRNTQGASQQVELPSGAYASVIGCRNTFFDCDLTYSLWATY